MLLAWVVVISIVQLFDLTNLLLSVKLYYNIKKTKIIKVINNTKF